MTSRGSHSASRLNSCRPKSASFTTQRESTRQFDVLSDPWYFMTDSCRYIIPWERQHSIYFSGMTVVNILMREVGHKSEGLGCKTRKAGGHSAHLFNASQESQLRGIGLRKRRLIITPIHVRCLPLKVFVASKILLLILYKLSIVISIACRYYSLVAYQRNVLV